MEALRLRGNALFQSDPRAAAALYQEAMDLYTSSSGGGGESDGVSLDEYTKCAGNLLTCLFKFDKPACERAARAALAVNPVLAKANAFIGRCLLDLAETPQGAGVAVGGTRWGPFFAYQSALQFLCRGVYELPALEPTARPYITAALEGMIAAQAEAASGGGGPAAEVGVQPGSCGNGVVALTDIPGGAVVCSLLDPFSVGPYEESQGRLCCALCAAPLTDSDGDEAATTSHNSNDNDNEEEEAEEARRAFSRCGECGLVSYCSAACAAAHRDQHATHECALLQKLTRMRDHLAARQLDVPSEFFEVAAHVVTTVAAVKAQRPGYERLSGLEAHATEVAQSLHPCGPLLTELFAGTGTPDSLVIHAMGVVQCNAFEVCAGDGRGAAQVLHTAGAASFFNHSCAPNCCLDGGRRVIATLRPVAAGEALTVSYMPQLYWPAPLRQEHLAGHYYFHCRCERCEAELAGDSFARATRMALPSAPGTRSKEGEGEEELRAEVLALCQEMRQRAPEEVTAGDVAAVERLLSKATQRLFSFHYLCHELRNTLTFLYAVTGDRGRCADRALEELLLWEAILPGALPVKRMKLLNVLQARRGDGETEEEDESLGSGAALAPHVANLCRLYNI